MTKLILLVPLLITGLALIGCGATTKEIRAKTQSERTDVFREVTTEGTPPQGFVDIVIRSSIKTHIEGCYPFEPKESLHGKPGYPFILNIDGQAVTWNVDGQTDSKPKHDKNGQAIADPEAGEGIKYVLEKKIRLNGGGAHNIFFGLPEEEYALEVDLLFNDGQSYVLEFKPVYNAAKGRYSIRKSERFKECEAFIKGIKKYEVFLDGSPIMLKS